MARLGTRLGQPRKEKIMEEMYSTLIYLIYGLTLLLFCSTALGAYVTIKRLRRGHHEDLQHSRRTRPGVH